MLFAHQKQSLKRLAKSLLIFDTSDPGTGKTRVQIEDFSKRRRLKGAQQGGKALVIAPKSLLDSAWREDFNKFAPDMAVVCAYASNREAAFKMPADVYVTNTDALVWLAKRPKAFFKDFDTLVIDECFPAKTLIDTPYGPTPIEMLNIGDLIYTSSGILPISNTFVKHSSTLIQMELEDGTTIRCTPNHPIATTQGWVEAGSTRNLSAVRLDLYKLNKQRSTLLWKKLRPKEYVGNKNTRANETKLNESKRILNGSSTMEQRYSLPTRNSKKTQRSSQNFRASTQKTWRKWTNSPLRTNDDRNATSILGVPIRNPNWKETRIRLRSWLQSRLRFTFQKMGFRNRRKFTHIAQTLGCEERFITGLSRVVRISRIECPSPVLVYNLQVNGPHTYSVAGVLVHNCTSIKHKDSKRSKAAAKISKYFKYRRLMTGTPTSNGISDIWHQVFILDEGKRLGKSFFGFRSAACQPEQVGPRPNMVKWVDRPGIEGIVGALLKDIVIRHKFEDCVDIPENFKYAVPYSLTKSHRSNYTEMEEEQLLLLKDTAITAVNGGVVYQKLLQIASGAVYDSEGNYTLLDTGRYELVLDLAEARSHSVVFFNWKHQRDLLVAEAEKRSLSFAVYDGQTSDKDRKQIVTDYQKGQYRVLFAHPQSAGHGLTLTKGTATIWASPTYNLEHFAQGWKRVHRIGQTEKTETVVVVAKDTVDEKVWNVLNEKDGKMSALLDELRILTS